MKNLKKTLCLIGCLSIALALPSGCSKSNDKTSQVTSSGNGTTATDTINGGKPVTLTVNLGEYNPSENTTPTQENPDVFNSTRNIAKKFMERYPNVTIKFDTSTAATGGGYVESLNQWMLPRIAAGNAMDVATNLGGAALFGNDGWFLNLSEYLNTPNEFIQDNKAWKDIFPSYQWNEGSIVNTTGEILAVPFMVTVGTATAYYYNKEAFKKAGVEIPQTWEEFMKVVKKLKAAGYIAFAPYSLNVTADLQNWATQFSLGPNYSKYLLNKLDYNQDSIQTDLERIRAIKEGLYNPVTNTYAMDIWKQNKRLWTDVYETGFEVTDYSALWQEGKVAILENGMWRLPYELSDTKRAFDFGMFPPPVISNDTYSYLPKVEFTKAGPNKPSVKSQFVILKSSIEKHGEGVLEAAVKYIKFMTDSDNLSTVVLEMGGAVLGATADCQIPPELNEWLQQKFPIMPDTTGWLPVSTSDGRNTANKLFEQWLYNDVDDSAFASGLNKISQQDADTLIKQLKIDTTDWKTK